jgi:prevent-host-death family protein
MVGLTEVRQRLTEILDQVLEGEHVVVTRHGEPVAELVPIAPDDGERPLGLAAFAGAFSRRHALAVTAADVIAMRSVARDREPPEPA